MLNPNLEKLDLSIDQSNSVTAIKCPINLKKLFLAGAESSKFEEINIEFNENLKVLKIKNFVIKSLIINERLEGLEELDCSDNKISILKLNRNLRILNCSHNNLTKLELNENLEDLDASMNRLTVIALNTNLKNSMFTIID